MQRPLSLFLLTCASALAVHAGLVPRGERPVAAPSVGEQPGFQRPMSGATDGTSTMLLWIDTADDRNALYAVRVDADGVKQSSTLIDVAQSIWGAEVVWTDSGYLVAWSDRNVQIARLDRDGALQSAPLTIAQESTATALAWSGSRALAASSKFDGTGSRLTTIDATGARVADLDLPNRHVYAAVGVQDAFVAIIAQPLEATRMFRAVRVTPDLQLSPSKDIAELGLFGTVHAASNGHDAGVELVNDDLSSLRRTIDGDTLAMHVDQTPELFGSFVVAAPDGFASVSVRGSVNGSTGATLRVTPFDESGARVIALDGNAATDLLLAPSPRGFLGAWISNGAVTAATTFDAALTQRTGDVRTLSAGVQPQIGPTLATSGDRSLLAWSSCNEQEGCTLRATRLGTDGRAIDTQPIVVASHVVELSSKIAVAFTGQLWVLAWQAGADFNGHVAISRIGADGTLLDATPLEIGGAEPALSSNGTTTILIYTGPPHGVTPNGVAALFLAPDGTFLLPPHPEIVAEGVARDPAIATNGTGFLIAFTELYDLGIHHLPPPGIYGARLDANGSPLDAQPFPIVKSATLDLRSASVAASGEDYLVAYALWEPVAIVDPPIEPMPRPKAYVFTKRVLHTGMLADTTSDEPGHFLGVGASPQLVANGARAGVFFRNADWGFTQPQELALFGTQIDANGAPTEDARLLMLGESYAPGFSAAVTSDGTYQLAYARVANDSQSTRTHRVFLRNVVEETARRRAFH